MGLVLHVPIVIPFLLECMVTYCNKVYSLKEREDIFFKRQDLFFFYSSLKYLFVFCFRLNIFTSKIWNFLLCLGVEGEWGEGGESWYTKFQYSIDVWSRIFLCFKLNRFDLRLEMFNLDWRQEIILIVFWKHFTWHTQNVTWEIFKLLKGSILDIQDAS